MPEPNFAQHFNQLEQPLNNFAYLLTKDREAANDLYQETAYKAFKNQRFFRSGTNMKAWLFTIMRNTFINQFRYKRRRQLLQDRTEEMQLINNPQTGIENMGESHLTMKELLLMIDRLEDRLKVPFLMHYQGFRYREIAERLDTPVGTVKSRIYEARQQLKPEVEQAYGAPDQPVAA